MTQTIGFVAGAILVLSLAPYFVAILKGRTKPSRTSWAIWSITDTVAILSYISSGARTTIWTGVVYAVASILIFGLAFKYGIKDDASKLNILCLIIALVAVGIWIGSSDPRIALYASICAVALGYFPTIKKVYLLPATEDTLAWSGAAFATLLNLFALTSARPEISLLPAVIATLDTFVVILLVFPTARMRLGHARGVPPS